ncbi:DNA-deoxyinosine glycosylase [Candidatus Mycobacterium wuenschmannii]|uniref:DNA-deoxyinosine glycosylase n=1 Tax=Candidatus Mycobacterium wuenschmannii TaxID=3027808 RepID=A0ABY8W7S7_9MYCO|nr:DNA-deoxyinosine glycosylase [Candidatus Mycobacterium wuenschmannii]WIM89814.1 DNA-deoxyinosine glycosylase [Candidatus Mycobacterium wuenschmannii]
MATPLLQGFPPIVDDRARVLILGSFPSVLSLQTGQYYGNPRNAFWPITGELFGFDAAAPYETRLAALQSAGVSLWDVLHRCRRAGSADSKIDPKSVVANDFGRLFTDYPSITRVFFNGCAAHQLYGRLVDGPVDHQVLPSSSPARAMPAGRKLRAWRVIAPS